MSGHRYQVTSDLTRDGMAFEVWDAADRLVVEVFYSDADRILTLTTFNAGVPVEIIQEAVAEAKRRLPPASQ